MRRLDLFQCVCVCVLELSALYCNATHIVHKCLLAYLDDIENMPVKTPPSPRPNSEFMRQPPDGAEKIKIIDELYVYYWMDLFHWVAFIYLVCIAPYSNNPS